MQRMSTGRICSAAVSPTNRQITVRNGGVRLGRMFGLGLAEIVLRRAALKWRLLNQTVRYMTDW